MSNFSPNPQYVAQLKELLLSAASGTGNHQQALAQMAQMQSQPDFFSYCAYIIAFEKDSFVRQIAGLQLKQHVRNPNCIRNAAVKECVMQALGDPDRTIRKTACNVISNAVTLQAWPLEVCRELLGKLQGDASAIAGATMALSHIVEDNVQLLESMNVVGDIANGLAPLIKYHQDPLTRYSALVAISVFVEQAGINMEGNTFKALDHIACGILDAIFDVLTTSPSKQTSRYCIKTMVLSLTFHQRISVSGHFERIGECIMQACQCPDEDLRTEAVEFWRGVLCFPVFAEKTASMMPDVCRMLIKNMVFSDRELGMMRGTENDCNVPDRPDDIKPRHFQGRNRDAEHHDEDEDDDDEGEVEEWNLRRVSALTLDEIAGYHGNNILDEVLQVIDQMMKPELNDWKQVEGAILAMGAISEGCYTGMLPYLSMITDRLLSILESPSTHFLVKSITFWTLRALKDFTITTDESNTFFPRAMNVILAGMTSSSKDVQESATITLGEFVEEADLNQLLPHTSNVFRTVNACFSQYQLKNRFVLFENVETLCRAYGTHIAATDGALDLLMTPLISFWKDTPNDSPLIFPLFECMSGVCSGLGPHIQPMAQDLWARTTEMIVFHTEARQAAASNNSEAPEPEYLITSLDLLSGLFEAVGSSLEPLMQNQPRVMEVVCSGLVDENPGIRQSAFSVLGDISKSSPAYVQRHLGVVANAILKNLEHVDETTALVVSNASWCLAELISNQQMGEGIDTLGPQHTTVFIANLVRCLMNGKVGGKFLSMSDNLALAIGRILHIDPDALQRANISLASFAKHWCETVRRIKDVPQREDAFRGFLAVATKEPQTVATVVVPFLDIVGGIAHASPDLTANITSLCNVVKQGLGARWPEAISRLTKNTSANLYKTFGIQ